MAAPVPRLHPEARSRHAALAGRRMLVCYLRPARRKARGAAEQEALSLLHGLDPVVANGGPLSERGGVFWVTLPDEHLESARDRLPRLGYTEAVDVLVSEEDAGRFRTSSLSA